ncbi:hypothetical protein KQI84_07830 [bacterium]|nr:hypothetical protein [bacterium]
MKIIRDGWRSIALILLLAIVSIAPARAKDLTSQLPEDTWLLIAIKDMGALREKWAASPYQEAWKSPEFAAIRQTIEKGWDSFKEEDLKELDIDIEQILGMMNGYVGVYSTMNEYRADGDYSMHEWDTAFVAEVSKKDHKEIRRVLDELLADTPEDAKKSVEEFKGEKIYVIEYYEEGPAENSPDELEGLQLMEEIPIHIEYTLTDKYFILCEGRSKPLRPTLSGLMGDNQKTIGAVDRFEDIKRSVGEQGDVTVYFNLARLLDQQKANPDHEELIEGLESLGLSGTGPMMASWGFHEGGLASNAVIAVPEEHRGLLSMLYAGSKNELTSAKLVPSNVLSYASFTANLEEIWKTVRAMARMVNPQADSILSAYLMSSVSNFNVDVEADIINNLKGEHAYYSRELPSEVKTELEEEGMSSSSVSSEVFLLKTTNGEKLVATLDQFFDRLTGEPYQIPLEHFTQRGFNIWTMKQMPGEETALRFSIALTPSHLILTNNLIEAQDAVRRVTGESNNSLATSKAFTETLADQGLEGLRFFSYSSPEAAANVSEQLQEVFALGLFEDVDLSEDDVPPKEWWQRYFRSSRQSAQFLPDMIVLRSQMYTAE